MRLRALIVAAPETPVLEVMDEDVPTVGPEDRAEVLVPRREEQQVHAERGGSECADGRVGGADLFR